VGERLVQELVYPAERLAEEEAAVPARRSGAEAGSVDYDDRRAVFGEEPRRRAAG
jgi:hypothetical protein